MDPNAVVDGSPGRVVIVDGIGAPSHRWIDGLAEFHPEIVASIVEVVDLCARDVVIVDLPELGDDTLTSLQQTMRRISAMGLLTADHHELADILRTGVYESFRHIVPRNGGAANVRGLVAGLRAIPRGIRDQPSDAEGDRDNAASWSEIVELLQWTVSEAVRVPGIIIRSFRPRSNKLELQLVFRLGRDFDRFHCNLPCRWRWPARARTGGLFAEVEGNHPTVQSFGRIEQDQEIYVRSIAHCADHAYLAILPWAQDDRITVALGLWLESDADANDVRANLMKQLHAEAVREVPEFTLPTLGGTEKGIRFLLEYNWVVTSRYAGPDRRVEDTTVINRYMLFGRRKMLAKSVGERVGGFVDGIPAWVGSYFVVYAVLAAIDVFCTSRFVSGGRVIELNPLLSPLIAHHPWLFLVTKNALALTAFAIVVRFHLFHRAKQVLRTSVGLYAALDLYWAILLVGALAP
jgi:hypothetical protein